MKKYALGFSRMGLLLYALQLLPNIIWKFAPPTMMCFRKTSPPIEY